MALERSGGVPARGQALVERVEHGHPLRAQHEVEHLRVRRDPGGIEERGARRTPARAPSGSALARASGRGRLRCGGRWGRSGADLLSEGCTPRSRPPRRGTAARSPAASGRGTGSARSDSQPGARARPQAARRGAARGSWRRRSPVRAVRRAAPRRHASSRAAARAASAAGRGRRGRGRGAGATPRRPAWCCARPGRRSRASSIQTSSRGMPLARKARRRTRCGTRPPCRRGDSGRQSRLDRGLRLAAGSELVDAEPELRNRSPAGELDSGALGHSPGSGARSSTTTGIRRAVFCWVLVVGRPDLRHLLPEALSLSSLGGVRAGRETLSYDLHLDVGVLAQVQVPVRVRGPAALRGDDHVATVVLAEDERPEPRLAALAAPRRQDQDRRVPSPPVAHLTVGLEIAADMLGAEEVLAHPAESTTSFEERSGTTPTLGASVILGARVTQRRRVARPPRGPKESGMRSRRAPWLVIAAAAVLWMLVAAPTASAAPPNPGIVVENGVHAAGLRLRRRDPRAGLRRSRRRHRLDGANSTESRSTSCGRPRRPWAQGAGDHGREPLLLDTRPRQRGERSATWTATASSTSGRCSTTTTSSHAATPSSSSTWSARTTRLAARHGSEAGPPERRRRHRLAERPESRLRQDGNEVVAAWHNGRTGMIGKSYDGTLRTAPRRPASRAWRRSCRSRPSPVLVRLHALERRRHARQQLPVGPVEHGHHRPGAPTARPSAQRWR